MFSRGIMPGSGYWIVKGSGAAAEPVSRACRGDLPEFGGPISATTTCHTFSGPF